MWTRVSGEGESSAHVIGAGYCLGRGWSLFLWGTGIEAD
jgi:hypothetical protein